ncbi:MAG: AtpZ/AtpI family protein [Calditrichaeota bacterium]|nr:AtpZ/AtpI family protein [Calditrichota bacterium]
MKKNKKEPVHKDLHRAFHLAAPYLSIAYVMIGGVLFFGYIGNFFDKKWDSSPLGIITGVFLGFGLGLYNMVKVLKQFDRE